MDIVKPTFYLKQICPCCEQGYPSFVVCPNCNYLTAHCEEMGDTFIAAKDLDKGFTKVCPNCKQTKTEDFILASSNDILNAGLTKDDYQ